MKVAASIGISIQDFWFMSAFELFTYIEAHNERIKQENENGIVLQYMNAAWQRMKKMPSLKEVMQQKPKNQSPEQMLAEIKRLNKMYGGTVNEVR